MSSWLKPAPKTSLQVSLLDVKNLRCAFHTRNGVHQALKGVSFSLEKGEVLGLVGESGSGKSITCYSMLGLQPSPPAQITAEQVLFDGIDLLKAPASTLRSLRGRRISMVFQDPMSCLNPYLRISEQLIEPLLVHGQCTRREAKTRARAMLEAVGIQDPDTRFEQFPHEFSGGMRQRVMIAMALITKPDLLIADEPTTALDVSVQAQIIDLLKSLQKELGMAVLYITHDLGVVAGLCDRVQVMYAGSIVESAPVHALYQAPQHPYTRALLRSIPSTHNKGEPLHTIPGLPPDAFDTKLQGCPFAPRCDYAQDLCRSGPLPALAPYAQDHSHACLLTTLFQ